MSNYKAGEYIRYVDVTCNSFKNNTLYLVLEVDGEEFRVEDELKNTAWFNKDCDYFVSVTSQKVVTPKGKHNFKEKDIVKVISLDSTNSQGAKVTIGNFYEIIMVPRVGSQVQLDVVGAIGGWIDVSDLELAMPSSSIHNTPSKVTVSTGKYLIVDFRKSTDTIEIKRETESKVYPKYKSEVPWG